MPESLPATSLTVALIGNPNTGKSTLFGALVGIRQRVGNYPGVTVEKKTGQMDHEGRRYELIDLPGLYSLAPRSRDEMVAVDVLLGRYEDSKPVDAVVCIVDAGNLRRNLYLVSQVLELGIPAILALNMADVAKDRGISLEVEELATRLGMPVVKMQANRGIGVSELKAALAEVTDGDWEAQPGPLPEEFGREVAQLESLLAERSSSAIQGRMPRYLVERLLLDTGGYLRRALLPNENGLIDGELQSSRARLAKAGCKVPECETTSRYGWVDRALDGVMTSPKSFGSSFSDRLDRVLTHRVWGTAIFILLMATVFQAVFAGAGPFMDLIEVGCLSVGGLVEANMSEGPLRSLLVDGVIGGVGAVLAFLPQIMILFLFIAILEDCGYMARAAYLMDKLMVRVGLSGKSFIPMLSAFACAIPGIMAARVIEDERDRLTTILVAPLMTCSARLPIYALLIAAFIPEQTVWGPVGLQGVTLIGLYLLGIVTAVVAALLLKRTVLRGVTPPFVMELPGYQRPSVRTVVHRVAQRGWLFVRCAGTMILAVSIVVWAALYYPHNAEVVEADPTVQELRARLAELGPDDPRHDTLARQLDHQVAGEYQRHSLLGWAGRRIEPIFRPLGWDWRISCAVLASFPAREVVVATLGVMYNLGEEAETDTDEGRSRFSERLRDAERDDTKEPTFNIPVALSIMVFYALCAQCAATLAVIKRETNSWRWPIFSFAYMTTLAYLGAMTTYQLGMWIGGG
jgi:ferrous iron transport protein B